MTALAFAGLWAELASRPVNTASWVLGRVTKETESSRLESWAEATRAGSRHVNAHTQTHPGVQNGLPRTPSRKQNSPASLGLVRAPSPLAGHTSQSA